jgi:phosphatidylinositol-3-phosphatase
VFVTWDEGVDGSSNRVATVVLGPSVTPGTRTSTRFTHYSLLRTTEQLLGLPLLGHAKAARGMRGML